MSISRKTLVALTAVAGLSFPLIATAPASASTDSNQCYADPHPPVLDHVENSGTKMITYETLIICAADRTVEVQDQRWEQDWTSADDPYGTTTYTITFTDPTDTVRLKSVTKALPDGDAWGDRNEEMYHSVRFRVTGTLDGVTSPWTKWENSDVVSFPL